jgi:predicted HD phosphohydrolase
MTVGPARSVRDIEAFLLRYSTEEVPLAGDVPAVLVSHGVQCAEVLHTEFPDDPELQIAGLLHDIGLLLVPGDELGHPRHGADYVRGLFGERTAAIISLHVDAQRYLEATVAGYKVTPPPTAAFAEQPEPMTAQEIHRFRAHPLFGATVALRHADDRAGDNDRRDPTLGVWRTRMDQLAARSRS